MLGKLQCSLFLACLNIGMLVSKPHPPFCLLPCVSSGCEVRGSDGPGAHLTFRPKDRPEDDDARGGSCGAWEAAAARAASYPTAAAHPEAAPDSGVSEAAWEPDPAASGSTSGAHQGSKCVFISDLLNQGICTTMWAWDHPWEHWRAPTHGSADRVQPLGALRGMFTVIKARMCGLREIVIGLVGNLGKYLVSTWLCCWQSSTTIPLYS